MARARPKRDGIARGGIRVRLGPHLGLAERLELRLELGDGRAESLGVLRGRGVEQTSGDVAQDGVQGLPGRGLLILRQGRERILGKPHAKDHGGGRRLGDGRGGGLDVRHRARACDEEEGGRNAACEGARPDAREGVCQGRCWFWDTGKQQREATETEMRASLDFDAAEVDRNAPKPSVRVSSFGARAFHRRFDRCDLSKNREARRRKTIPRGARRASHHLIAASVLGSRRPPRVTPARA